MHVNVARRHQRQAELPAELDEARKVFTIVGIGEQFHGNPRTTGEAVREPAGVRQKRGRREGGGDEQREAARYAVRKIVLRQSILTLVRPAPRSRDELGEVAVALAVGGEEDQAVGGRQRDLGADDEAESAFLRRSMRAHHASERALVGDGERRVAERVRALHQLFRMRGAAQEREVACRQCSSA